MAGKRRSFVDSSHHEWELQSLVAMVLRNFHRFKLKGAMMQFAKETPAKAADVGLLAADTSVEYVFFCFIESVLTDMAHRGLMK